eukprot:CAMPEP_0206006676 /NCGR_PEP_ID=MMETSP1464-20131121/5318_1 /ASSEMBLY_ACC=CAM_ASM_001124 /TAXON_ID=119497 /ORGANISM="Exanthemachrysis gayraliae, Strain RCC1523" /LENGTH=224 /DNA_ID=CAMNT_0053380159 /DNA_START=102 /DNA_END=775 /DNA_ORIENTATION=-
MTVTESEVPLQVQVGSRPAVVATLAEPKRCQADAFARSPLRYTLAVAVALALSHGRWKPPVRWAQVTSGWVTATGDAGSTRKSKRLRTPSPDVSAGKTCGGPRKAQLESAESARRAQPGHGRGERAQGILIVQPRKGGAQEPCAIVLAYPAREGSAQHGPKGVAEAHGAPRGVPPVEPSSDGPDEAEEEERREQGHEAGPGVVPEAMRSPRVSPGRAALCRREC